MKEPIFILFLATLACGTVAQSAELQLENVIFSENDFELSGLVESEGKLLAVADESHNTTIFHIQSTSKSRFKFEPFIKLKKLVGFKKYRKSLSKKPKNRGKFKKFDLEDIAVCKKEFYLANERTRHILEASPNKVSRLNLEKTPNLFDGPFNAGIEGVAVDCEKKIIYLAKERAPRFIASYNLESKKLIYQQRSKIPADSKQDFSALHFYNGHLYVLERFKRVVSKLDPSNFKPLASWSYKSYEDNLYKTNEPYGQAESLVINSKQIIIGFDNNKNRLSAESSKKYGISGPHAAIMYFKKPTGF